MKPILDGIRIIDWSVYQVGPYAGAMLADLGADVIHVEEKGRGDYLRGIYLSLGIRPFYKGRHIHYEEHNRNKRSLAVDLRKTEGKEIMYRLAEKSDVFMTNFRPAGVKRAGMDYETIKKYHPEIIYASATGLGSKGPYSHLPSIDNIGLAWSGAMMCMVPPGGTPHWGVLNVGDRGTAVMLAWGILAALIGKLRYGKGQEVKTSQLGTMINLQGYNIMLPLLTGQDVVGQERTKMNNPLWNHYRCQDGKWITLGGFMGYEYWPPFCKALGINELENDPRFADMDKRQENAAELIAIIDKIFITKTRAEWRKILEEHDLLHAPIYNYSEVIEDPQALANEYIKEWDHPVVGKMKIIGPAVEFSETPSTLRTAAPELGQHTEEILVDICGYNWNDIARFKDLEVI